eukprot:IDg12144t1
MARQVISLSLVLAATLAVLCAARARPHPPAHANSPKPATGVDDFDASDLDAPDLDGAVKGSKSARGKLLTGRRLMRNIRRIEVRLLSGKKLNNRDRKLWDRVRYSIVEVLDTKHCTEFKALEMDAVCCVVRTKRRSLASAPTLTCCTTSRSRPASPTAQRPISSTSAQATAAAKRTRTLRSAQLIPVIRQQSTDACRNADVPVQPNPLGKPTIRSKLHSLSVVESLLPRLRTELAQKHRLRQQRKKKAKRKERGISRLLHRLPQPNSEVPGHRTPSAPHNTPQALAPINKEAR